MGFVWLLAAATAASSAAEPDLPPLTLAVSLRLEAELGGTAMDLLRRETERLFLPAGLGIRWLSGSTEPAIRVVLQNQPSRPMVYGCSRGLHDHRLGLARPGSREIILWIGQVARASAGIWEKDQTPRPSPSELGRALGRTLAHELGHVLLGERPHERRGLMRSAFKHRDLTSAGGGSLKFSSQELRRLRAAAERLGLH